MTLAERLAEYVRACFTGLWVQTHEPDDAMAELARLCRAQSWTLAAWDVDRGLAPAGQSDASPATPGAADPLAAIRALGALASADGTASTPAVAARARSPAATSAATRRETEPVAT